MLFIIRFDYAQVSNIVDKNNNTLAVSDK